MARVLRILPALWLLLLLSLPAGLYVLGARQAHPARDSIAPMPFVASPAALSRERTYDALEAYALDHLPLRQHALELRARLSVDGFHTSPVVDARVGRDGWLFLREDTRACNGTKPPVSDFSDALEVTAATLVGSGRRAGVVITGSKLIAEAERRPWVDPDQLRCVAALERDARARLAGSPALLDLEPAFAAMHARGGHTFLKLDTHWNDDARLLFMRAVFDRIRPGFADEARVAFGPMIERVADLPRSMEVRRADRDHVVLTQPVPDPPARGSVVLIGDSQTMLAFKDVPGSTAPSALAGPLRGQTWCHLFNEPIDGCDAALPASKVVIVQSSARHAREFTITCGRIVSLVAQRLRGSTRTYAPADHVGRRGLNLDESPATLHIDGRDAPHATRLLRVPVLRGAVADVEVSASAGSRVMPCVTPAGLKSAEAVIVPVPAGVPLGDVRIRASAPPGTRFGTPELIELGR